MSATEVGAANAPGLLNGRFRLGAVVSGTAERFTVAAADLSDGGSVIVKFERPGIAPSLVREYAHLRRVNHPNLARVIDVGQVPAHADLRLNAPALGSQSLAGQIYLVTAAVGSDSLASSPLSGSTPQHQSDHLIRVALGLADALAYMHGRSLIHGDVTPHNVVLAPNGDAVLVDFGLAGSTSLVGNGQGTPGFAAPEALVGQVTTRSDLFGLGATLYFAWTGVAPFGIGRQGVLCMLERTLPPAPGTLKQGLPAWFDEIVMALLHPTPSRRPASALLVSRRLRKCSASNDEQALLSSLTSDTAVAAGDPLAGVFVGRTSELSTVAKYLIQWVNGDSATAALVFTGLPGSGRHTLWAQALSDFQLRAVAFHSRPLDVVPASAFLESFLTSAIADPAQAALGRRAQFLSAVAARSARGPVCVLLHEGAAGAPQSQDEWTSWWPLLAEVASPNCMFIVFASAGVQVPAAAALSTASPPFVHVAVPPFEAADVEALCTGAGLEVNPKSTEMILQGCSGNAAAAALLVRRVAAGDHAPMSALRSSTTFRMDLMRLPAETKNAIFACWWDLESQGDVEDAIRRGWLRTTGRGDLEVPQGVQREALWGALTTRETASVAALAQAAASHLPPADPRRAEALRICGEDGQAFDTFCAAAAVCWEAADFAHAECWWQRAEDLSPVSRAFDTQHIVWRAQALAVMGKYESAKIWLQKPTTLPQPSIQHCVRMAETEAWLARRQGALAEAQSILEKAERQVMAMPHGSGAASLASWAAARLAAQRARVAVSAGRHQESLLLATGIATDDLDTRRLLAETRALSLAYLGRPIEAAAALEDLRHLFGTSTQAGSAAFPPLAPVGNEAQGRLSSIAGVAAQLAGDMVAAEGAYAGAIAAYQSIGDVHGHANARLNQAMAMAEQGKNTDALAAFAKAFEDLLRLGAFRDATAAAFNAGLLMARLGDASAVAAAVARLSRAAAPVGADAAAAWLQSLAATQAWHSHAFVPAAESHADAARLFAKNGDPLHAALSWLCSAEAWADAGRVDQAHHARSQAGDLISEESHPRLWAQARIKLAQNGVEASSLAHSLRNKALQDVQKQLRPSAFRSAVLAARLLEKQDDSDARDRCIALALRIHEEIKLRTPSENQEGLDADPDAAWLLRSAKNGSANPTSDTALVQMAERLSHAQARLRRFVRLSKRINSELRLPRLLETILDTVIELTEAERGFLLLRDAQGQLVVRAARNIEQTSLQEEALAFSRSIAEQVAHSGAPVITVDAADDARFRQALSVSDLQLRSVVAVPLTIRGQVEGTIYVDNRLRQGAFGQSDVSTLLDFAELAALALGNARLVSDLQRRDRQIDTLNRRLEKELAARKEEISSMRVELSDSRESFALRFDYKNIVGRSPRMMELLKLLDRISETNLPVIIQGESGTGKELVARALVANGPRKDKAFITENCAAIPETLLESTLFGYTRGAFTGAERDTRGLFAIAHEGTLFLDEVGEMSPGLQGKLLRVLQEGEYRRVGGERVERTDVRVVVATNKDLQTMVDDGRFRQDLFFRLAVVRVVLPPLRERTEDIPLLVRHFLEQWKQRAWVKARAVSSDALARLCNYRWPGNIRELQNELERASAFAGETIEVVDLSPHIAQGPTNGGAAPQAQGADDLDLKSRVERLEKGLLREALSKFDGNQTRAAHALGLSRFGLQKKLRRYGFTPSS